MAVFIDEIKHVWDIREKFLGQLVDCQKCPITGEWINPGKSTEIEPPEYDPSVEKLKWNSENNSWELIKLPTQEEIDRLQLEKKIDEINKIEITDDQHLSLLKKLRTNLLYDVDVYIMKNYIDNNLPVPNEIKEYKQQLRDLPQRIESGELPMPQINRLKYYGVEESNSMYEHIDFVDWPVFPFDK